MVASHSFNSFSQRRSFERSNALLLFFVFVELCSPYRNSASFVRSSRLESSSSTCSFHLVSSVHPQHLSLCFVQMQPMNNNAYPGMVMWLAVLFACSLPPTNVCVIDAGSNDAWSNARPDDARPNACADRAVCLARRKPSRARHVVKAQANNHIISCVVHVFE